MKRIIYSLNAPASLSGASSVTPDTSIYTAGLSSIYIDRVSSILYRGHSNSIVSLAICSKTGIAKIS